MYLAGVWVEGVFWGEELSEKELIKNVLLTITSNS
jgi:hypothetical protein